MEINFEIAKEEGYKEGFIAGKKALSKEAELSLDDMPDDLKRYGKTYKAGYSNGYKSGFDDGYKQGKQKEAENMKEICAPVMENITKEMGYQRALDEISLLLTTRYRENQTYPQEPLDFNGLCKDLEYFIKYRRDCNPYKSDNKGLDENGAVDIDQYEEWSNKAICNDMLKMKEFDQYFDREM